MNVLVAINDNYIYPLLVMLESLYKTNTWDKIDVYLFYSNLSEKHIKMIRKITRLNENELHPIRIQEEVDKLPTRAFSAETYYRLYAFKYLPKEIDKILFLDPDMIVCQSLERIYITNMKQYFYCAVPDIEDDQIKKTRKIFSMSKNYKYVNSGFQLMNLNEIRKQVDEKKLTDFIVNHAENLPYLDQDVLNVLFADKIQYVEAAYNYDCRFMKDSIYEKIKYQFLDCWNPIHERYVLHYKGRSKPWNRGYTGKFQSKFFHYARIMKKELKKM